MRTVSCKNERVENKNGKIQLFSKIEYVPQLLAADFLDDTNTAITGVWCSITRTHTVLTFCIHIYTRVRPNNL